jgi:hypothetical protein
MTTKEVQNQNTQASPGSLDERSRQHAYVEELKKKGPAAFSLVAAEAFVEGMRDSGYKSTGTAVDELVDNAIQAQAERVDIIFDVTNSKGKQEEIGDLAVIDNGHGMEPDMIRAAILWGGTHRANDRSGFGRYGFGLPSAAVSITPRYHVYSKTADGEIHGITIDLKEVASGVHTTKDGTVIAPEAGKAKLPEFVTKYLGKRELRSGTVIVLEKPDRLTSGYRKPTGFHKTMLQHLGLIYRQSLRNCALYVNGEKVQAVDPLFLDPSARYYDVGNGVLAQSMDPLSFTVKTADGKKTGKVNFRFSLMPPDFQGGGPDGKSGKPRLSIMKENQAYFIVTRNGRQVDLVRQAEFKKEGYNKVLQNYDRNWAVELDFDPVLDEDFGITVNKQQINIHERMWNILEAQGVGAMVKALWEKFTKMRQDTIAKEEAQKKEGPRLSEVVMAESEKLFRRPAPLSAEKQDKADEKLKQKAEKTAEETGEKKEAVERRYKEQSQKERFKILTEANEGAPFYRAELFGSQIRVYLNIRHKFYSDVYAGPDSSPRVKAAIEILLFVLAGCELDATGDLELFYQSERNEWSKRLNIALAKLDQRGPIEDEQSANHADEELKSAAA